MVVSDDPEVAEDEAEGEEEEREMHDRVEEVDMEVDREEGEEDTVVAGLERAVVVMEEATGAELEVEVSLLHPPRLALRGGRFLAPARILARESLRSTIPPNSPSSASLGDRRQSLFCV